MMMLLYQHIESFMPLREADIRALHHELLAPYKNAGPYVGRYKKNINSVEDIKAYRKSIMRCEPYPEP
jgi:hypothetical protein